MAKQTSEETKSTVDDSPVQSPFEENISPVKVGPMVGLGGGRELTKTNVDEVLDEVSE